MGGWLTKAKVPEVHKSPSVAPENEHKSAGKGESQEFLEEGRAQAEARVRGHRALWGHQSPGGLMWKA